MYTLIMFGRRPSAQVVFVGSLIAAIVMAIVAVHEATVQSWPWAIGWGVLALIFTVDAIRSWSWTKNKDQRE